MITVKKSIWLWVMAAVLMSLLLPSARVFGQQDKVALTLRLLPDYYYREVVPGSSTTLYMEVRNDGTSAVTNIAFSAAKPEGWVVGFEPGSINYLGAGSSQRVDINIVPAKNADKGEYTITLLAEATETRSATSTVLQVKNGASLWLWIGLGVAALVVAGFVIIFFRQGKQ